MMEKQGRFDELLEKYSRSEINEPEFNELCDFINNPGNDAVLKEILEHGLNDSSFKEMDKVQLNNILHEIFHSVSRNDPERIGTGRDRQDDKNAATSLAAPLQKERGASILHLWKRVAAAAAIILMVSVGGYFVFRNNTSIEIAKLEPQEKRFKNDIAAPSFAKSTITLADGSIVALDSVGSGQLALQGNVKLVKRADGTISYEASPNPSEGGGQLLFNTLNNPRGSKVIDMTLSDGSRVWLDAGSSVTYPVAFVGNERKVSITGEAYFEVAHRASLNPSQGGTLEPFIVEKGGMQVKVLGTHFNVNAYDDEGDIKVTLLEGSVKVSMVNGQSAMIKPGEQAKLVNSQLSIVKGVDLDETMAWKNGRFYFDGADIKTMMRQLSRWYNVDVTYSADIKTSFVAKISRDEPVTELLKILELTNLVHFKIDGNKIEVIK